jgi:hypothetical protein
VVAGRIHRVVEGVEVWEEEPTLRRTYAVLYNQVCFLIRRNRVLREALVEYGGFDLAVLSNIACTRRRVANSGASRVMRCR